MLVYSSNPFYDCGPMDPMVNLVLETLTQIRNTFIHL